MPEVSASARRLRLVVIWALAAAVLGSGVSVSLPAHAADKKKRDECISASEDGQLLKVKGQLKAAREKLAQCSDKACPGAIRKDCEAALEELDKATPTIVFAAKDAKGRDLTAVTVSVDGDKLLEELDGKAIAIDPGKHDVRFEAEGLPPHQEKLVVREGEKARVVLVTIAEKPKPRPKQAEVKPGGHGPSTATWVVGGIGAAALAGAGVIGFVALQKRSSLYDRCGKAGTCSKDDVDSVYRLYDISYVTAGIGGALLATGAVLYFTSSEPAAPGRGVSLAPTWGGAVVSGRF